MPFFDFKCENCEFIEEKFLKRSEIDNKFICPICNSQMRRLICNPEFKIAGTPPKNYQPLKKSRPKSQIPNIHEIRRIEKTK